MRTGFELYQSLNARICNPFWPVFNHAWGLHRSYTMTNHRFAQPLVAWATWPSAEAVRGWVSLTVLRFVPVHGYAQDWVLYALKSVCARLEAQGCEL